MAPAVALYESAEPLTLGGSMTKGARSARRRLGYVKVTELIESRFTESNGNKYAVIILIR